MYQLFSMVVRDGHHITRYLLWNTAATTLVMSDRINALFISCVEELLRYVYDL
ncbi:hypothetical protein Hanom_Chr16g01489481 [Helianthus anomalus]